jgi:threonine aldolase
MPTPPSCSFASDNAAGAHPSVLDRIADANTGHALAYGEDRWTADVCQRFDDLFGRPVSTLLTLNGTGSNVLALATLLRPGDAVICTDWSHVNDDEAAAPERILGAKLIPVASTKGRLSADQIDERARALGNLHHAQPGVVTITQATEWGTLYSIDDIANICDRAHAHGMLVHLDGARIANAVAALGGTIDTLRDMTVGAGVDAISFGGTKNGLLGAEAVIHLVPIERARTVYLRKQVNQLGSKMRFVAAQFIAALDDGNWLRWASHANSMARRLYTGAVDVLGAEAIAPPQVNSVFPVVTPAVAERLREWCFFWEWDASTSQQRWMTAWDTTETDVDTFIDGLRAALSSSPEFGD